MPAEIQLRCVLVICRGAIIGKCEGSQTRKRSCREANSVIRAFVAQCLLLALSCHLGKLDAS